MIRRARIAVPVRRPVPGPNRLADGHDAARRGSDGPLQAPARRRPGGDAQRRVCVRLRYEDRRMPSQRSEVRVQPAACRITWFEEASAGKSAGAIKAGLAKIGSEILPTLEEKPAKLTIEGDPVRGPANAKVTIVEFSDFQCPYCAKAVGEVKQLMQKFPKDVRLVFKQYPLDTHSQAEIAAEAALSAQAQGKFWECTTRCTPTSARFRATGFSRGRKRLASTRINCERISTATNTRRVCRRNRTREITLASRGRLHFSSMESV